MSAGGWRSFELPCPLGLQSTPYFNGLTPCLADGRIEYRGLPGRQLVHGLSDGSEDWPCLVDNLERINPPSLLVRSLAYVIDCGLAFAFVVASQLLIFTPLRSSLGISIDWFYSGTNTQLYTLATISLPTWLYFSLLDCSSRQATLGKRLMSLHVVNATTDSRIGLVRSLLRSLMKLLPWELAHIGNNLPTPLWYTETPQFRLAFAISGLLLTCYLVSMQTNSLRRCIHDMVAGTVVVKRSRSDGER